MQRLFGSREIEGSLRMYVLFQLDRVGEKLRIYLAWSKTGPQALGAFRTFKHWDEDPLCSGLSGEARGCLEEENQPRAAGVG